MKRILAGILLVGLALSVSHCGKFGKKKGVAPEDIGKALAIVLCEKNAGCRQGAPFDKDQCLQEISSGLAERLKTRSDLVVRQAMVDDCSKTIAAGDCSVLMSEKPPTGCEFLE